MTLRIVACLLVLGLFYFENSNGHGRLMDPVSRSSAWRKNLSTLINYNDNELFCGGATVS